MFKLQGIGIQSFILSNKKLIKSIEREDDFKKMLDEIVELARERCPVKSGNMMDAIRWVEQGKGKYVITCNVPYSLYIEYGTRYFPVGGVDSPRKYKSTSGKMASVPFLRSSIWDVQRKFPEYMQRTIDLIYLNK